MNPRLSYTLVAPIYDLLLRRASGPMRRASFASFDATGQQVLISGIGSGLDIPYLPPGGQYVGVDLTPAMLKRAKIQAVQRDDIVLHVGNVMALPYRDQSFDAVVMHLILAVVPEPHRALCEATRVLKPGGEIFIIDKFLHPGERAPLRRLVSRVSRRVATRLDVVFEQLLACCDDLVVEEDVPLQVGGWFRRIKLRKTAMNGTQQATGS